MSYLAWRVGVLACGGALALLGSWGCASPYAYTRPAPAQVASAEDAVNAARTQGADRDEHAAPFLTAAERELAMGKQSLANGDNRNATLLLARASADGELSHALVERTRQ